MIEYRGLRAGTLGTVVRVGEVNGRRLFEGTELPLRLDIARVSPEGFDWGHRGRGPTQLAVALLAHALDAQEPAARTRVCELAEPFKQRVVAELPSAWRLSREMILRWVDGRERPALVTQILKEAVV